MLGATGYVLVDSQFSTDSYVWGAIYTVVICTEMARHPARLLQRGTSHQTLCSATLWIHRWLISDNDSTAAECSLSVAVPSNAGRCG